MRPERLTTESPIAGTTPQTSEPKVRISEWLDDHALLTEMAKAMYEVELGEYDEQWKDQPWWCHKLWRKRAIAAIKAALKKSSNDALCDGGGDKR